MQTVLPLFNNAGIPVNNINDILQLGIYITTAVKTPKQKYTVEAGTIKAHLPILAHEIELFENLKAIMLMGDVAKKAYNMYARSHKQPTLQGSTYKIRKELHYFNNIRVFPSYIMTGGNILIEKSKVSMIQEDIRTMYDLLK